MKGVNQEERIWSRLKDDGVGDFLAGVHIAVVRLANEVSGLPPQRLHEVRTEGPMQVVLDASFGFGAVVDRTDGLVGHASIGLLD